MELLAELAQAPDELTPLLSHYSLEMTARNLSTLEHAAAAIPRGTPVSITFLPAESYADRIQAARALRALGLVPIPHLSARRVANVDEAEAFLAALAEQAAVDRIFLVGGDAEQPLGPFADAQAFIESGLLERHGIRRVGIAGYPEGHPAIPTDRLWAALRVKHDALLARGMLPFIITQFGFEAGPILGWLGQVRERGIQCPVRIGVPGPARIGTLLRYAAHCGVGTSARAMSRYGLSLTRLVRLAGPASLIADIDAGLPKGNFGEVMLHFYAFGGLQETAEWIRTFQEAPRG